MPTRPEGRAFRTAIANFKGGAGKSTVALHFRPCGRAGRLPRAVRRLRSAGDAEPLDGADRCQRREHRLGHHGARSDPRDRGAEQRAARGGKWGRPAPSDHPVQRSPIWVCRTCGSANFIQPTNWPTIDLIPSCANAAFVEFASAQYRHLNPEWSFFAAVSRFLDQLPDDQWDLIFFDCPPAIGYQSMNAVFAADMLYIPSGPGYWEYDSTTSLSSASLSRRWRIWPMGSRAPYPRIRSCCRRSFTTSGSC